MLKTLRKRITAIKVLVLTLKWGTLPLNIPSYDAFFEADNAHHCCR